MAAHGGDDERLGAPLPETVNGGLEDPGDVGDPPAAGGHGNPASRRQGLVSDGGVDRMVNGTREILDRPGQQPLAYRNQGGQLCILRPGRCRTSRARHCRLPGTDNAARGDIGHTARPAPSAVRGPVRWRFTAPPVEDGVRALTPGRLPALLPRVLCVLCGFRPRPFSARTGCRSAMPLPCRPAALPPGRRSSVPTHQPGRCSQADTQVWPGRRPACCHRLVASANSAIALGPAKASPSWNLAGSFQRSPCSSA